MVQADRKFYAFLTGRLLTGIFTVTIINSITCKAMERRRNCGAFYRIGHFERKAFWRR